jgi:hypothetical protein
MPCPLAAKEEVEFLLRTKVLLGSSGEKNENSATCRSIVDGLSDRHDSRLRYFKQAAKLLPGMYLNL